LIFLHFCRGCGGDSPPAAEILEILETILFLAPLGWLINFNEDDFTHGMIKVPNRYFNSL